MTSKLLRIVPVLVSLSIPAFAADPAPTPAPDTHHESKDKKKKADESKKAEDGKTAPAPEKKEEPKK